MRFFSDSGIELLDRSNDIRLGKALAIKAASESQIILLDKSNSLRFPKF